MEMRAQCDAVAIASRAQRNGGKQITAEERIGRKKNPDLTAPIDEMEERRPEQN